MNRRRLEDRLAQIAYTKAQVFHDKCCRRIATWAVNPQLRGDVVSKNLKEVLAMPMIRGGIIRSIGTEEHLLLWKGGPQIYCRLVGEPARHPGWMRLVFGAAAGLGLCLPVRQIEALTC